MVGSVPTTSYAVLGLLTFGEVSGYDLKRLADRTIKHFFWSPASSQIYSELRRLTSLGYVTEREVRQERRPDKRLYKITPEGDIALRHWLDRPDVEPDVRKSPFLLRTFFGGMAAPQGLRQRLRGRREELERTLSQYRDIEHRIKADPRYFFPYLILRSGILCTGAELQWVDETLETLANNENLQDPDDPQGSQDGSEEVQRGR